MQLGLNLCEKLGADLLLATDPDSDRVGTAVLQNGTPRLISGNEMGVLLLDYICRTRLELHKMPEHPVAVRSIVSTTMTDAIAAHYGVEMRQVLTGFKYIGEQIAHLEAEGHPERFIFGFEESYGYLAGGYVRDKDAVVASMLICDHVGSLSLWDRQPSNAPPLLLSPAGLALRRGPHTKTRLGLCPKTPLPTKLRLDTSRPGR